MSDLASVMLQVMDDEIDAFWCFVGLMDDFGLAKNFDQNEEGMNDRLHKMVLLLRFVDPGA